MIKTSHTRCCSHLYPVLNPHCRKETIEECIHALKPHVDNFQAIAVCGYSMCLIAPAVADALGKDLIIVRKKAEKRYSGYEVEGAVCDSYIIIDDLVCSYKTIRHVVNTIADEHHSPAKLYGIYLYKLDESSLRDKKQVRRYLQTKLLNTDEQIEHYR